MVVRREARICRRTHPQADRMSRDVLTTTGNRLLDRLPQASLERIRPHLELVELPRRSRIHRRDALHDRVFFPASGVVSLSCTLENTDSAEIAIIGNEGVIGITLMMDGQGPPSRSVVQVSGQAWAMHADALKAEVARGDAFQRMLLLFTQALITQMGQVTLCTRRHRIVEQVARWLLLVFDRARADVLAMTHEAIADTMGVRREGITDAMGQLEDGGGIVRGRGKIRMLDRSILLRAGCPCYRVICSEYHRLLEETDPALDYLRANAETR